MRKKGFTFILFCLFTICLFGCSNREASLRISLNDDEKMIGEYQIENKIGDNILDIIKNVKVEKRGFTFVGWAIDGEKITNESSLQDKEVVITPIFEANEYKIVFLVDGKIYIDETLHYGDSITKPNDPSVLGKTFVSWDQEIPSTMPDCDLEFKALFTEDTYNIIFKVGEEEIVNQFLHYGDEITTPEDPIVKGYRFVSWDQEVPSTMPDHDLEFKAVLVQNEYKVSFKVNDETISEDHLHYGDEITKPEDPIVKGYRFVSWDQEVPSTMPDHDLEFKAVFEIATYNITFVYEDGTWPTESPETVNILLDDLFTDFHTWLNSTEDLSTFIKDANGVYKNGKWQDVKGKLYAANLKDIRENSEYFINDAFYHDKWIGFFNELDKCISEINPSQDLWSSTYVGCIRLYEIADHATRFSDAQKERLMNSLQIEITPVTTYQMGDSFTFMDLVLKNGREFLGWYLDDNLITGITPDMASDITVVAKLSTPIFPETITINNPVSKLEKGVAYTLDLQLTPDNITHDELVYESSEPKVATIKDGVITTLGYGSTMIKIYSKYNVDAVATMNLEVFPNMQENIPVIYMSYEIRERAVINVSEEYDLLFGIKAYDSTDGDITSKIKLNDDTLDPYTAGSYKVTYTVTNTAGNTYTLVRDVVVVDHSELIFIGHAGCYLGIMNTEEAFINAITVKGYKALECDVKQTSDGVFVVCHDNDFGGYDLATTTYDNLKDVEVTQTRGGISYTSKICTFKRYLEICKQYDVYAVVELKSSAGITNSDQSRMDELMQEIIDMGMLDKVIFLGSQYKCLEWVRNNGYTNPCQYLVNSCESETIYNRCVEWNFDVSFNISYANSTEWIDRYHEAGLKVSSYTFSQYSDAATLQSWIDKGVDFVTCDVLTENDVTIPKKEEEDLPEYQVIFKDIDGTILKDTYVLEGKKAVSPFDPKRDGYIFTGWDKEFSSVTENMIITATYDLIQYNIKYDANFKVITESSWSTKQEFVNEFYNDLFTWISQSVGQVTGLTLNGSTYTVTKNTSSYGTVSFSNVTELMNLGIYYFEQTIGTIIYKPIEGTNSDDYVMEEDSSYFLNTEPYRSKYKALNAYFLYAITNHYTSYNKNYKPTSAGKVQIFFRFHQWQLGTNIVEFNSLPKKYDIITNTPDSLVLPTTHVTYNVTDSFTLDDAVCEGYVFDGWFLDQACTKPITTIVAGTTGNITLYAKWHIKTE